MRRMAASCQMVVSPNARTLCVASMERRQEQIEGAMLPCQNADCLPISLTYIISHVGIGANKFCFDRSTKRTLRRRWPDVRIS